MIPISRLNRWTWTANVGVACGILLVALCLLISPQAAKDPPLPPRNPPPGGSDVVRPVRSLSYYRAIWERAEPPVPPPPSDPRPVLRSLLSVEGVKANHGDPGRSCVFLTRVRTRESIRAYIGDVIEGARITAIPGSGGVTFDYGGNQVTLGLHDD